MSDAKRIKELLRERIAELAQYLLPNGHREGVHWCVGSIEGEAGKSFKICIAGEKAGFWGDFADSGKHSRSLLDLWMQARNVDFKTALREAADWTGHSLQGSNGERRSPSKTRSTSLLDWLACVAAFTERHAECLAKWRGYSLKFCSWLKENGLVGLFKGFIAFPVLDRAGKVVTAHYRQKDGSWRYYPQGAKVRPLIIGELIAGDPVHIFESQWDAFAFMDLSGERSGIIITRGAGNGALVATALPPGATAYLFTQNDEPGTKWEQAILADTKCTVKRVKIPAPHKDLNDWTRAGATDDDLLGAMNEAETLREREKSWDDALSESAVTSSELKGLKLAPRKKLLGDWLCEGDCGFIFAFRGVGKTWFAMAIAQAVSKGSGKLGEWEAHEPVRVLYVDSEMPPDLMRDRSVGLQANDNLRIINHDVLFERSGKVLNIANREIQDAITRICVNTGVKVLFIDNLSTAAKGVRENEADDWEKLSSWLLDLRRRKIAVAMVHHAGRSGEMRGTTKREDSVFWIIALDDMKKNSDDKRGARFVTRFTKPSRNTQEEIPAYEWHFVTEPSGEVTIAHKIAQSVDVFRQVIADGVTECGQIAQEMKISPATVSRFAKKAIDAGWLKKRGRNYELIDTEKEVEK
jgi:hypothetical protein